MDENTKTSEFALQIDGGAHDPLEDEARQRVRGFIEAILEEELQAALGRSRYQRPTEPEAKKSPRVPQVKGSVPTAAALKLKDEWVACRQTSGTTLIPPASILEFPRFRGHKSGELHGPTLSRETLDRLTARFERASVGTDDSGLGLAIVAAIAARIGSPLVLKSPRSNGASRDPKKYPEPLRGATWAMVSNSVPAP